MCRQGPALGSGGGPCLTTARQRRLVCMRRGGDAGGVTQRRGWRSRRCCPSRPPLGVPGQRRPPPAAPSRTTGTAPGPGGTVPASGGTKPNDPFEKSATFRDGVLVDLEPPREFFNVSRKFSMECRRSQASGWKTEGLTSTSRNYVAGQARRFLRSTNANTAKHRNALQA